MTARQGGREFVGILEGSWRWALVSLIVAVVGTFAILTWGLPAAARHVAFAFDYLKSQGRDPGVLRELLLRLERRAGTSGGSSWFASHPATGERAPE